MSIQMIALDLDGTALQPDHLTMSQELKTTLEEAHQRGIYVIPVTGRPYRLLPPYLHEHPAWESFGVLCNGAQIMDLRTSSIREHYPLQPAHLESVLEIAEKHGLPVEFNADGRLYLTRDSLTREMAEPKLLFHCRVFIPRHGMLVDNLRDYCRMEVEKIHINCIPQEKWAVAEEELSALDVSVVCEKRPNLEVTHRCATKGNGLKTLCRKLGIPLENVMALGDSGNDMSMLKEVGLPVAMGSAPEEIKAVCRYVTGTNEENGAGEAIRRFVFA